MSVTQANGYVYGAQLPLIGKSGRLQGLGSGSPVLLAWTPQPDIEWLV